LNTPVFGFVFWFPHFLDVKYIIAKGTERSPLKNAVWKQTEAAAFIKSQFGKAYVK
jgi:hypothetical protein